VRSGLAGAARAAGGPHPAERDDLGGDQHLRGRDELAVEATVPGGPEPECEWGGRTR
jgi:hypothetical protein